MGIKVTRIGTGDPLASGLSSTGTVSGTDVDWPTSAGDVVAALDDLTDVNAPAPDDGDVLAWDIGASEWVPVASGSGNVATDAIWDAKGDLAVGSGANTASRLAVGSNGDVLTVDPAQTLGVKWAAPSGGAAVITTKDEGTSLSTSVTTLDFVGAGVVASGAGATTTVTIAGGGGATAPLLDIPPGSAHASDDEFSGSSLDAKWTNPGTSASGQDLTVSVANGYMLFEPATTGTSDTGKRAFFIRQPSPSGSFSIMAKVFDGGGADDGRTGIFIATTGGKAYVVGSLIGNGRIADYLDVTTYSESADWSGYAGTNSFETPGWPGAIWLRLSYDAAADTVMAYYTGGGIAWRLFKTQSSVTVQPNRMGLCIYGNNANVKADHFLACDWFRVTEP